MNITGLLLPLAIAPSILKYIKRTSNGSSDTTPPTSEAGKRPTCPVGQKAIYDVGQDRYRCVVDFK